MRCSIRIKGHLDPSWQNWFGGLEMVQEQEGTTLFSGSLQDQAALHGVLTKIRGLSLTLLSLSTSEDVSREEPDQQQAGREMSPNEKKGFTA